MLTLASFVFAFSWIFLGGVRPYIYLGALFFLVFKFHFLALAEGPSRTGYYSSRSFDWACYLRDHLILEQEKYLPYFDQRGLLFRFCFSWILS